MSDEEVNENQSMLPCWRLDIFYESGNQELKEMAIEITGLHITDKDWPHLMTHLICQNQELKEVAAFFKRKPENP